MSIENAGRQIATYSAPFGVLYRTHSPGLATIAWPAFTDSHAAFVLHYHFSGEHQCKFLELGPLAGLGPSRGAAHMRDARVRVAGIDAADILVENFSLRNGNAGGSFDQFVALLVS